MGMNREQIYSLIEIERNFQDANYNPNEILTSGATRGQRDLEVAPGILMLEAYADKAKSSWVGTKGSNLPALQQVAKIAALAVRILERCGGSEELLNEGLR
jgi:hypothetical protein